VAAAARRRALTQGHPGAQATIVKGHTHAYAPGSVTLVPQQAGGGVGAARGGGGKAVDDALDAFLGEMDDIGAFDLGDQ
jgi:hypothetical protein